MILKTLYLKIGDLGLPTDYTYGFLKRSRFVCNYLEREVLDKIRFVAEGFNRISISVSSSPKMGAFVNSANVACVDVPFTRAVYDSLIGDDLALYYMECIKQGVQKCDPVLKLPISEILDGLRLFTLGGMKNEWQHLERRFRKPKLTATLNCSLTQDEFLLRLIVHQEDHPTFDKIILRTDPDENAFAYRFKEVVIEGGCLVVTSRTQHPLLKVPLSELAG